MYGLLESGWMQLSFNWIMELQTWALISLNYYIFSIRNVAYIADVLCAGGVLELEEDDVRYRECCHCGQCRLI